MYDRILLPTDGSPATEKAIQQALDLAEMSDATLHVVSVADRSAVPPDVRVGMVLDELEANAEDAVAEVRKRADEEGVAVTTTVIRGVPHRAILDYAEDEDVDVIVMGTHGRRGLNRYLVGSVTEKVVRLSDVPVLTVRMTDSGE
ncbi:universal stress protein [Halomicrococcus sp. SG-WS-1]|uniref:universal stress protein n=1 Tax=Halomicrococcus sp. SG-WS-1 TaxID=3439057 RepID=UPI003F7AC2F8